MKKLLMFSVFLLGSISFATAQTGKKAKDTKKVVQSAKTPSTASTTGARPQTAKKLPPAAASLVEANKTTTTDKKN